MLPIFKDNNQPFQLMQSQWASQINPVLANPLVSGRLIPKVSLVSGSNTINHGLGAKLQGWSLVRKRQWLNSGTPTTYDVSDVQDSNSSPALTLQLYCTQGISSNPVVVDLWVF